MSFSHCPVKIFGTYSPLKQSNRYSPVVNYWITSRYPLLLAVDYSSLNDLKYKTKTHVLSKIVTRIRKLKQQLGYVNKQDVRIAHE